MKCDGSQPYCENYWKAGPREAPPLLDRVRSGEANFADAVQEFTSSQVPNETVHEVSCLQIALDDAGFKRLTA